METPKLEARCREFVSIFLKGAVSAELRLVELGSDRQDEGNDGERIELYNCESSALPRSVLGTGIE